MNSFFGKSMLLAIFALTTLVPVTSAHARPCLTRDQAVAQHNGHARYRNVEGRQCWYTGERTAEKSEFELPIGRAGSEVGLRPSPSRRAQPVYSPEERAFWLCGPFCDTMIREQWPRR